MRNIYNLALAGLISIGSGCASTKSVKELRSKIDNSRREIDSVKILNGCDLRHYGNKFRRDNQNAISVKVGDKQNDYFTGVLIKPSTNGYEITHAIVLPGQEPAYSVNAEKFVPWNDFTNNLSNTANIPVKQALESY